MADKLNTAAANKLLKLLEEPTRGRFHSSQKTKKISFKPFWSRCQVLHFNGLEANIGFEKNIEPKTALQIAHQAQEISTKALQLLQPICFFLKNGLLTVRAAFGAISSDSDLILWSE
jgi:DNA polymerase-3 subunit delta'